MTHTTHPTRPAGVAIAAALALAPTSLLAQMTPEVAPPPAEPVLVIPQTPQPAAQPAPTIVLPTELPNETPEAVVESEPPVRAATALPAPQRATTRAAAPATPAAPPAEAMPLTAAEPVDQTVVADTPIADETIVPLAGAEQPVDEAFEEPVDGFSAALIVLLGGLLAIGLAIWGFVAIGRRKTVDKKAAAIVERPLVTQRTPQPEPVAAKPIPAAIVERPVVTPSSPQPEPLAAQPVPSVTPFAPTRINPVSPAPSMTHSGASVPLPRTIPQTFEERDALLRRMIEAKPDRANPFIAPLQRRKRARLILQSLGRDFGDVEPWIDLSQYPANWPELANRRHAAA